MPARRQGRRPFKVRECKQEEETPSMEKVVTIVLAESAVCYMDKDRRLLRKHHLHHSRNRLFHRALSLL